MHDERSTHPDRRTLLKAMGAGALAATAPIAGAVPAAAATATGATPVSRTATGAAGTAPAITPDELAHLPLVGGREFPIGLWWPPPPLQTTLPRYREIKDAGFTYTHSNNYLWADAYIQKYAMSIADQVGLTVVVDDPTVRWMRNDFRISTEGGDFTLTPEQAKTKLKQVLDTYRPRSFWEIRDGGCCRTAAPATAAQGCPATVRTGRTTRSRSTSRPGRPVAAGSTPRQGGRSARGTRATPTSGCCPTPATPHRQHPATWSRCCS
ncbi:hypothetical protein SAMN05421678_114169 [Actinopolymorpha cephalotaxi]|uniref:Uncharacterized protein n=1 Tax=Actinopolymorpha cephalotaxi TaxID=504797 RepID=A0A1I2YLX5_9ACTN|nr:hypothetical protein [Actinopolymorpha cephalotaxi]NYH86897.1 hypothetical protein [Actinopolymorpha cephalotaxi]SFH26558.1 hypothetical protein SAMN05421678_114169 [Actinopolymorpha cephalotaxi]